MVLKNGDIAALIGNSMLPSKMVRKVGLEPTRLAAQVPKTCVYTNFTTPARYLLAEAEWHSP